MWTTRPGPLADAEWRHRLASGIYSIRGAGIHELDRDESDAAGEVGDPVDQTVIALGRLEVGHRVSLSHSLGAARSSVGIASLAVSAVDAIQPGHRCCSNWIAEAVAIVASFVLYPRDSVRRTSH